jgi:serine/threonine protein kinase
MLDWSIGKTIQKRFTITDVKSGGMAWLFIAEDKFTARTVAIKTPRVSDDGALDAFQNEVRVILSIKRAPFLINAYEAIYIEGRPCLIMEYIEGGSMRDQIGQLSVESSLDYSLQTCAGLMILHDFFGIIHGDLKPENLLLTRKGIIRITDFGLGSLFQPKTMGGFKQDSAPERGVAGGSYPYMAPELWNGAGLSRSSDVYAFGMILWELLVGGLPMSGGADAWYRYHANMNPECPSHFNSCLSTEIDEIVAECLQKDPSRRASSFHTLLEQLESSFEHLLGKKWKTNDDEQAASTQLPQELPLEDRLQRAIMLYRERQTDSAIEELGIVLSLNPRVAEAWLYLGNSLALKKRHEEAIQAFEQAAGLAPGEAIPVTNMGNSYMALGRYADAVETYTVALRLDPSDRVAAGNLPVAQMLAEHTRAGGIIERF